MSHRQERYLLGAQGFPRVSGDEPFMLVSSAMRRAFSPRERG